MRLWDFMPRPGRNEIRDWLGSLSRRDQARVDQKLGLLVRVEFDLLIHTKCLAGPIDNTSHIYKLRIRGDKNIRLLLCKGPDPKQMNGEYTLLMGAIEPNRDLVPKDALKIALQRRNEILDGLNERRCPHEPARTFERAVQGS